MGRAQIKVEANEKLLLGGVPYRVAEHPALPGVPYVQRGGRGFVIQLVRTDNERMALKYFKLKYRVPALVQVAEALEHYADLPGLRAAKRTVFTQQSHGELLARYLALEYGMLMPWLPGMTWYDLITTKAPLTPQESLRLAQATCNILAGLEASGLAHCDVCGANVMFDRRTSDVQLVDIEEMYGPDLPRPEEAPAGQDGYQHRTSREQGQWQPYGDRFGAAILLAEVLAWSNGRVRYYSADEHFFAAPELQDTNSARYRLLSEILREEYGPRLFEMFESAWRSPRLADCPPLSAWQQTLAALNAAEKGAQPAPMPASASPVVSRRRTLDPKPERGGEPLSASQPAEQPGQHGQDTSPIDLEGKRLCRNCGEINDARGQFCKRCGFYIGTGARPLASQAGAVRAAGSPGAATAASAAAHRAAPPPQAVPLNRNLSEVVVAHRVGTAQGAHGMQRVEMPRPADDRVEANAGSWLVVALIIGGVLAVILLALIAT